MPDEGEERFVHRIEAFSDIVIGFSLAQLGATLVVPGHAQALLDNPGWMLGFLWTFALVCLMWWNHNRIFRLRFTPTPLAMFLNFVLLATIVLIVYFAQVFSRVASVHDGLIAARLYFSTLGASALITGSLYFVNHGWVRGAVVNVVSGAIQIAVVIAAMFAGDNAVELPIMGITVPIAFTIGGYFARRARQAVPAV
jgi:uncharacterized membrane protein